MKNKGVVLEGIIWSKINQAEKDKYHIFSLICNLKNKWTNLMEIVIDWEQTGGCQSGKETGIKKKKDGANMITEQIMLQK